MKEVTDMKVRRTYTRLDFSYFSGGARSSSHAHLKSRQSSSLGGVKLMDARTFTEYTKQLSFEYNLGMPLGCV